MPLVSVIIPVYNGEPYLAEMLDSLVCQTIQDFEAVIVDDGSTDRTADILTDYAGRYPNLRVITQENEGVSAARNHAIANATGKYIAFLDADDQYSENYLEGFTAKAEATQADLVVGRIQVFSGGTVQFQEKTVVLAEKAQIDRYDPALLWNFLLTNKLFRRDKIEAINLQFEALKYSEDAIFCMRYIMTCDMICGTMDGCYRYRRRTAEEGQSVSQQATLPLAQDFTVAHDTVASVCLAQLKADQKSDHFIQSYLDAFYEKTITTYLSQFYRLIWISDESCHAFCAEQICRYWNMTSLGMQQKLAVAQPDIAFDHLELDRRELAAHPKVSCIIGEMDGTAANLLIGDLYGQFLFQFEILLPESLRKSIPPAVQDCENLLILPDAGFLKQAKKQAKSSCRLVFKKPVRMTGGTLKRLYYFKYFRLFGKRILGCCMKCVIVLRHSRNQ